MFGLMIQMQTVGRAIEAPLGNTLALIVMIAGLGLLGAGLYILRSADVDIQDLLEPESEPIQR